MAKKKFSFLNEVFENMESAVSVSKSGQIKVKRSELKAVLEEAFLKGAKEAAGGERIRFPVIGALVRKDVKARKAGKGVNPFTGDEVMIKARPATKKPRWSFPKSLKETFSDKKHW